MYSGYVFNPVSRIKRIFFIYFVFFRYGLDEVILATPFFSPVRYCYYFNPWHWYKGANLSRGRRVRLALEKLGPIFIKFGQMLSTRPDLLPPDILQELALLQDRVPPFSGEKVKKILEKTYQKPVHEIFKDFSTKPLASASVAQVHEAVLWSGEEVVVKVLRPGVMSLIQRDVDLLYVLANMMQRFYKGAVRFKPKELVMEFERTLLHELDLRRESANASQLRRNFLGSPLLYVPKIYWPYTEVNVMVLEQIHGIPVARMDLLKEREFDLKKLAERGIEVFFTQVFKHNFFHADMHPGNIFVSGTSQDPTYIVVDFGIMGTLTTQDQRYLAENLLAFFKRDYRRVAELHRESGWVPQDVRIGEFEAAMRTVCEPMFERPMKEISFGQLLLQLIQTAQEFHIEIQPQLMLLQKTLVNIEGLGRQLYPDLDLWKTAKPFLENWVKAQLGPRAFLRKIKENLPYWAEKFPDMPYLFYNALEVIAKQDKQNKTRVVKPKKLILRRLLYFIFGLMLGIFSTLFYFYGASPSRLSLLRCEATQEFSNFPPGRHCERSEAIQEF